METFHTRSNSLPSKQHPFVHEFEEQLSRLRSSQEASSTSITSKLSGLRDLHERVDQMLLLPSNRQALSNEQNQKLVNELLDRSLRTLDLCNTTKDTLTQIKESTQELGSILRTRRGGDVALKNEVKKFSAARKLLAKKSLNDKATKGNGRGNKRQEKVEIVGVLREVESITLEVFESLILFVSGPKSRKSTGWSLISKRSEASELESVMTEIVSQKAKKSDKEAEENAQNDLKKFEMCVRDFEEELESLYRRLIKNRVSLLNILN